jgi:hypothetical protein
MDEGSTKELTRRLFAYSERNRVADIFDQDDFVATFEQLSPFVTSFGIHFNEFSMIRSRAIEFGTDFEHVKQMGYPPPHKMTRLNRCNFPGQTILYASSNPETTFLEVEFSDKKPCAFITQFNLKPDCELVLLSIGELDHYRRYKRTRLGTPGLNDKIDALLAPMGHYERMAYQFVDAYLADYFGRTPDEKDQRNLYDVTARIANALLTQDGIDGLIYPSVRHQGGLNYAIKPDVFDQKFVVGKYQLTTALYRYGYGLFEYYSYAEGDHLIEGKFALRTTYKYANARVTWPLSADE